MRRAFTLIELVVAVGLLAMVLSFAGMIFKVSIEAHRTGGANAEIMVKLRAITDQLNADFRGLRKFSPRMVYWEHGDVRADCIAFFANGDFQSTRQYGASNNKTVIGNVASIFYGQAGQAENPDPADANQPQKKILVRRQTILTADASLQDPNFRDEYYGKSLSQWRVDPPFTDPNDPNEWVERRVLNPDNEKDLVTYMAKGVDNFTIQYVGLDDTKKDFNEWRPENKHIEEWKNKRFRPKALKFTFTLYDSKGVISHGRTFTHIVYVGD